MTDPTRDAAHGRSSPGEPGSDADYRIREAEARLDRRLADMEARHARTRGLALVAGAGFVLALVALVLSVRATGPTDGLGTFTALTTQQITLRDGDGVERGRLGTDPEGRAVLSLSDRDGRERIRLTVLADGSPGVTINGPDAQPRAVLGYLPDGTTNLVFTDRTGAIRTLVGVGPDGEPAVSVFETASDEEGAQAP